MTKKTNFSLISLLNMFIMMELDLEVDESPKQASHKTIVTECSCFRQREGEVSP